MTAALSFQPKKNANRILANVPQQCISKGACESQWTAFGEAMCPLPPSTSLVRESSLLFLRRQQQSCVNLWWFVWRYMQWCPETREENVARTDLDFKVRTLLTLFEYITLVLCTYVIQSCILTTSEENSNELLTLVRAWNKCSVASLFSSITRTWGKSVQLFDLCPLAMSPAIKNFGTGKLFCMFYIKEKVS